MRSTAPTNELSASCIILNKSVKSTRNHAGSGVGRQLWSMGAAPVSLLICNPWLMSDTLSLTRSQPRNLLSIAILNSASSGMLWLICNRVRILHISFSFKAGFCPVNLPLFHGAIWGMLAHHIIKGFHNKHLFCMAIYYLSAFFKIR